MQFQQIPQDDLIDVMEMTNKIESCINEVLKENDRSVAVSALIGACINCLISQCNTLEEVMDHRNIFIKILDRTIRTIRIQEPQQPPFS